MFIVRLNVLRILIWRGDSDLARRGRFDSRAPSPSEAAPLSVLGVLTETDGPAGALSLRPVRVHRHVPVARHRGAELVRFNPVRVVPAGDRRRRVVRLVGHRVGVRLRKQKEAVPMAAPRRRGSVEGRDDRRPLEVAVGEIIRKDVSDHPMPALDLTQT